MTTKITVIEQERVERTTRGIYAENNAPSYGTGTYDTYYKLYIKQGDFSKLVESCTSEVLIKNAKFDLDRAIKHPRRGYSRRIKTLCKSIRELEANIKTLKEEKYDLEDIQKMQIFLNSL